MITRLLSWCCVVGWVVVAYLTAAALVLNGDEYGDRYLLLAVGLGVLAGAVAIPSAACGLALLHLRDQRLVAETAPAPAAADDHEEPSRS